MTDVLTLPVNKNGSSVEVESEMIGESVTSPELVSKDTALSSLDLMGANVYRAVLNYLYSEFPEHFGSETCNECHDKLEAGLRATIQAVATVAEWDLRVAVEVVEDADGDEG
jgi:hypothetical protein